MIRKLTVAAAFCFLISGCSNPSTPQPPIVTGPNGSVSYVLYAQDLRAPRANETYLLWLRPTGSTDLIKVTELFVDKYKLHGPDSLVFSGKTALNDSLLRYDEALISIEPDTFVTKPGSVLMRGTASALGVFDLDPGAQGAVADLRFVSGLATFATLNSDSTRVHHEFYLADLSNPTPRSSLSSLPNLGYGWHYAVWVTDSVFSPAHLFYYGAFLHPDGHDSDSTQDSYAFPGGFEPPALDNSHGKIEITIEPDFHLADVKTRGPSPFPILEGQLPLKIYSKLVVPLTNVVSRGLPGARLLLKTN